LKRLLVSLQDTIPLIRFHACRGRSADASAQLGIEQLPNQFRQRGIVSGNTSNG